MENDDKFRYESPLDECCPLVFLKFVLMKLETGNATFFKEVMGVLNQTQIDTLLLAIKLSEEYIQKLREQRTQTHQPNQV